MKNLRGLRLAKDSMTMKALGDQIGVAESTISLYESGKREPDYATLLKLSQFFGVPVDFLLTGETCEWERDYYDDYERESSDDVKLSMIQQWGLPYRFASDYFRILNSKFLPTTQQSSLPTPEKTSEIETLFSSLSPEKRKAALEYLEYLAARGDN